MQRTGNMATVFKTIHLRANEKKKKFKKSMLSNSQHQGLQTDMIVSNSYGTNDSGEYAAISMIVFTAEKTLYTTGDTCVMKYIQPVAKDGWKDNEAVPLFDLYLLPKP